MASFSFAGWSGDADTDRQNPHDVKKRVEEASGELLDVEIDRRTVRLRGAAKSQAAREKAILAAGNIKGIEQVHEAIAVEAPEPESAFHDVRTGDTLWTIAEEHYGDGAKYRAILEANQPMLADPDRIYPGQKLRIPPQA